MAKKRAATPKGRGRWQARTGARGKAERAGLRPGKAKGLAPVKFASVEFPTYKAVDFFLKAAARSASEELRERISANLLKYNGLYGAVNSDNSAKVRGAWKYEGRNVEIKGGMELIVTVWMPVEDRKRLAGLLPK